MGNKTNKTTTVRIDQKDYYRLEDVLENEFGTDRVAFAEGVKFLLDEYEN